MIESTSNMRIFVNVEKVTLHLLMILDLTIFPRTLEKKLKNDNVVSDLILNLLCAEDLWIFIKR